MYYFFKKMGIILRKNTCNFPVVLIKGSIIRTVSIICLLTSLALFFMAIAAWKIVKSWLSPEAVNKIRYRSIAQHSVSWLDI